VITATWAGAPSLRDGEARWVDAGGCSSTYSELTLDARRADQRSLDAVLATLAP